MENKNKQTYDAFLNNECMEAIRELAIKHPNDMDLGNAIRGFLSSSKSNHTNNQISIEFVEENE